MGLTNGVHHLAISTKDMKGQIAFFSEVLGAEFVALFPMHGVPRGWHGFVKLCDSSYLAFVQLPEMAEIEPELGVTHSGSGMQPSAPGTMQHLALNVDSEDELLAMRDRIRSHGVNVFGPIEHGLCKSIYFAGLEDLTLEIATSEAGIDPRAWIDPVTVRAAGISPDELARFTKPAGFASQGGKIAQPPLDPDKPHMRGYSAKLYERMVDMTDDEVTKQASYPDPPVKIDD